MSCVWPGIQGPRRLTQQAGLLRFGIDLRCEVRMTRLDSGAAVLLDNHPNREPGAPELAALMGCVVGGAAKPQEGMASRGSGRIGCGASWSSGTRTGYWWRSAPDPGWSERRLTDVLFAPIQDRPVMATLVSLSALSASWRERAARRLIEAAGA